MNRRIFLFGGAVACSAIALAVPTGSDAAQLRTSKLRVEVLSVTRESLEENVSPAPGLAFDKSSFNSKARIVEVLRNQHGLSAGTIIDIHYEFVRLHPASLANTRSLSVGEIATIQVFGSGTKFQARF